MQVSFKILLPISKITLGLSISCMLISMIWIFFRHDGTIVNKKRQNNGTQLAHIIVPIAAIFPILFAISLISQVVGEGLKHQFGQIPLMALGSVTVPKLLFDYGLAMIPALFLSVIAYVMIRGFGAESGCKRDIKFMKKF